MGFCLKHCGLEVGPLSDGSRLDRAVRKMRDARDVDALHTLFLGRKAESEHRADN
jgi:hypothetical protein